MYLPFFGSSDGFNIGDSGIIPCNDYTYRYIIVRLIYPFRYKGVVFYGTASCVCGKLLEAIMPCGDENHGGHGHAGGSCEHGAAGQLGEEIGLAYSLYQGRDFPC